MNSCSKARETWVLPLPSRGNWANLCPKPREVIMVIVKRPLLQRLKNKIDILLRSRNWEFADDYKWRSFRDIFLSDTYKDVPGPLSWDYNKWRDHNICSSILIYWLWFLWYIVIIGCEYNWSRGYEYFSCSTQRCMEFKILVIALSQILDTVLNRNRQVYF